MRVVPWLLLLATFASATGVRLGLAFEGQLLPIGVSGFLEYRTEAGGLVRAQIGYDYLGLYLLGELGFALRDDPWRRTWASLGGGYYLVPERDAPELGFLLAGAGYYDAVQGLGAWAGVMLPGDLLAGRARDLGSGGGLALFSLLRVRVELASLEFP